MRLHHLEVTAFGPFADTVRVDFDELSEAGLFLLSGPTGAGKTSVLDAVCFALYGDVPGDRSAAKRLRCDQAAPGLRPLVTLEVTLGSRRFRLVRSPAWERPKKRGAGLTNEQARVTFSELADGRWQPLSSRARRDRRPGAAPGRHDPDPVHPGGDAPAGSLPGLPASPIRGAPPAAPAALPHRPIRAGRALAPRPAPRAAAGCAEAHQLVVDLVSRLSEATAEPVPDDWDAESLPGWVAGRRTTASAEREAADVVVAEAGVVEQGARTELESARAQLAAARSGGRGGRRAGRAPGGRRCPHRARARYRPRGQGGGRRSTAP